MFDLSGKNVVVVGGFGEVSTHVARILMHKNVNTLIICDRIENNDMLKKLQAESGATKVVFVHINLLERSSIEHAANQIAGVVEQIDVLINGAGILADQDIDTTIGINLIGLIQTTLALMPLMDKTQGGRGGIVLNLASAYGLEPAAGLPVYAASNHGVVGFTRSLADKTIYNKTAVAFITVCPGLTDTEALVHIHEHVSFEQHAQEFWNAISKAKKQTPTELAANVIKAIEMAKNGAIYLANVGQLKEVVPTVHFQLN